MIEITKDASVTYRLKPENLRIIERKEAGGRWKYYAEHKTAAEAKAALVAMTRPERALEEEVAVIPESEKESLVSLIYDYGKVDSSVREIVEAAAVEIKLRERRAAEDTVAIGERLIQVKDLLPHGQFGEWMRIEFDYSDRIGRELMNVARRFRGKTELSSILSSTVMRMLAAPSVSDEAIAEAVEIAQEQGSILRVEQAKAITDRYRQAAVAASAEWTDSERERLIAVKRGNTVLANLQHDHALIAWAQAQGLFERIDRATIWGNPFVVDEDGTREEVILKYEDYYFMKSSLWPKLESLRGKVLGCWCYPEDCHGHVLINFLKFDPTYPFEVLGFGYPIGEPEDFARFGDMKSYWGQPRDIIDPG